MLAKRAIASILGAAALAGCGGAGTDVSSEPTVVRGVAACAPEGASEGAALFAEVGCLGCHTYADEGSQNLDAPDLTSVGATGRGVEWYVDHLRDPPEGHPSFATLGGEQLRALGEFLDASRGC